MAKQTKILVKRKKFIEVEIPIIKTKVDIIGDSPKDIENKNIKLDLTRMLKGKSLEATFKVKTENEKIYAYPTKIKLMSYFIRRMMRKKISYVEDSFKTNSQESVLIVKPFLITRKKVSRAIRKTLRNKTKNWLEEYISKKKNNEIFLDILSNKLQKSLSTFLKKVYPLSLCEIRVLEIERDLKEKGIGDSKKEFLKEEEIEKEKIKEAEEEIKRTQERASRIEKSIKEKTNSK